MGQLSLCATTTEPGLSSPGATNILRAATAEAHEARVRAPPREATAMRSPHTYPESSPHVPQLEKAHVQQ